MGNRPLRKLLHPIALPAVAGVVAVTGIVVLAGQDVDRSGAAFTDTASGTVSVESGRVSITPDTPVAVTFADRIGPGAATTQTVEVVNSSTVSVPAACVVVDVLPVRDTSPNPFNASLASAIDVTVERKPGAAAAGGAWTTVRTDTLAAIAGTTMPAFGAGLEAATANDATNQNGATVDNGETITYRFTFSMPAATGNTVGGVDITGAYADAEFQIVAENVTAGTCANAVSA
ncbi:MAG: hypothetical protein MUE34_17460 [Acidimicrobiales bacterium]|jgi:hypothetical protein|nr:hypothetical protein [Acidimicrobiales bacterium]